MELIQKVITAVTKRLTENCSNGEIIFLTKLRNEILFSLQNQSQVNELNERNSVDEREKSFLCIEESENGKKCMMQCEICKRAFKE